MQSIEIYANAKINLALSILGKRADGYHEIDTVMQAIDLYDLVTVTRNDRISVACDGIAEEENLATRAAVLFFEKTGIAGGAHIEIEKHIPIAAGLGGGSADAAAVLTGLNTVYHAGVSDRELSAIAASLGADIPFFLLGGTARAKGIGERLTTIGCHTPWYYVLFAEGEKPSTGEMYRLLDKTAYPRPDIDAVEASLIAGDADAFCAVTGNSFSVLWEKSKTGSLLLEAGAKRVLLSGSGPTRFAVFCDEAAAKSACLLLQKKGIDCRLCRPVAETATNQPSTGRSL